MIPKIETRPSWDFKLSLILITILFLVVIPLTQIFWRGIAGLQQMGAIFYYGLVLLFLVSIKKIPLHELGFSRKYLRCHFAVGFISGGIILIALPFLDALIDLSGLSNHELFSGTGNRAVTEAKGPIEKFPAILANSILTQFFFTGLIFQSLKMKINPILALYLTAAVFTLAQLNLTLGVFLLGIISLSLFHLTGSLYASIIFHASCSLAGIFLIQNFTRLITFFGFLF